MKPTAAQMRRLPKNAPGYVRACVLGEWSVCCVRGLEVARFRYKCGSRRCPDCRPQWGARAYARVKEALEGQDPNELVFCVFTLDQRGRYGGEKFDDPEHAMQCFPWQKFMRRFKYWCRKHGHELPQYVATIEVHANGWPHLNVIFKSRALAELVDLYHARCSNAGIPEAARTTHHRFRRMAVDAGFGPRVTMSVVKSAEAVSKYTSKVATHGGVGQLAAEATKRSQDPVNAPRGFRSLRSSRRFLPPHRTRRERDPSVRTFLVNGHGHRIARSKTSEQRLAGLARQAICEAPWPREKSMVVDPVRGILYSDWKTAAGLTAPGKVGRRYRLSPGPFERRRWMLSDVELGK